MRANFSENGFQVPLPDGVRTGNCLPSQHSVMQPFPQDMSGSTIVYIFTCRYVAYTDVLCLCLCTMDKVKVGGLACNMLPLREV